MKNVKCLLTVCMAVLFSSYSIAQDFSNKGKEFWLAYSYHVGMINTGGAPTMTLYISSDVATTYTVEIFGGNTIQTGNITAGQVAQVIVPNSYFVNDDGAFNGKAIHVTAVKPVVLYSFITRSAASAATLCLPTTVLGKEYYSANYTQVSNEANSNSYITIVGVEDGTNVEITPTAPTKGGWAANSTHTISLNKGDVYQVLGTAAATTGVDLTGTKIRSVASGTGGCKRIAVFSGSGKISIGGCSAPNNAADNLYQQLYPTGSWGRKYLTVPSYQRPNNYYRITRNDPTTNITLNGVVIPSSSFNNNYYEFQSQTPNNIAADKPISVAQYFTSQGCQGNSGSYDPDMIVLNPVEQNIDKVTLVSSSLVAAGPQHHIHVIMRNGGTGKSSFKLDGAAPSGTWMPHPFDPDYSYLYLNNVSQGYHTLASDSGYNAIAYGYASNESYGYSAGANVKDLYQFVSIQNPAATVSFPAACRNTPFYFSMTFPYQPTQIQWAFNGLFPDVVVNTPVSDSSWVVNGKTLYRYKLLNPYTVIAAGTYPIKVLAQNPTSDGCSGEQEINYDLVVTDQPTASFTFTTNGCLSDPVQFTNTSNTGGRPISRYNWNFGDGNTSSTANPVHNYASSNNYLVVYSVVSDIGCVSSQTSQTVNLSDAPTAIFNVGASKCVNSPVTFTEASTAPSGTITIWRWNFGDGSAPVVNATNAPQTHIYTTLGTYTVTLQVETASGCKSLVTTMQVVIAETPAVAFTFGNGCLPGGAVSFTNTSGLSGTGYTHVWDFGDGGTSTATNPTHVYSSVGPFNVKLTTTQSITGCIGSATKQLNTIYPQPQATFVNPAEVCLGSVTTFADQSTAINSTITQWLWTFSDGTTSTEKNPNKTFASAGTYVVTLKVTSAIGCVSTVSTGSAVVNPLPTAAFAIGAPNCVTEQITFTDASSANAGAITNWNWDLSDGTTFTKTNAAPFTHTYSTTGDYAVKLTVTTNKGCIASKIDTARVKPLPIPGFIMPENCLSDPFSQFTDTSTIADGTESGFSYLWNFGDGNATPANPNTATEGAPRHKYTQSGNFNVTMTVTSANGCSASIAQLFTVNGAVPESKFSLMPDNHCSNDSVRIQNNSTVDVGSIVKLEIFWDASDLTLKTVVDNPVVGGIYSFKYPEFYNPATKSYSIRMVAYSGESCLHADALTLSLKATPEIRFEPLNAVCGNLPSFQLTQATTLNSASVPGNGIFSGRGVSASGFLNPSLTGAGLETIRYTYTGNNGCVNFGEQAINVLEVPTVDAGPDKNILEGGSDTLRAIAAGNGLSYLWSPATWLSSSSVVQPKVMPLGEQRYTLTVTSADGCVASDDVLVKFLKAPKIPNVFTPNGDGRNDKWEIMYLETYPGATVEIYNRYGQIVYRSVGYSKPWDGTYNGAALPVGTYYYIINPKNGRQQMTGFVDLIR